VLPPPAPAATTWTLLTAAGTANAPSVPAEYVQVTVTPDAAQLDDSASARACSVPDSAANGSSRTNPVAINRQPEWEIGPPKGPAPIRRLLLTCIPL
jgi:hypothetical protein